MPRYWAGVDAGKAHHHCVVIDDDGKRLLSRKVQNDENALLELLAEVIELAGGATLTWACDLNHGGAALLLALLAGHGQRLLYIPGRTVHHAAQSYRGDGKTDAKDAAIIADQARMRRDLQPIRVGDDIATDLRLLTARRADLVMDRTRAINRLRATLLEYFPALEAAFDYATTKTALVLLTRYQTPEGIRKAGPVKLANWLRKHGGYNVVRIVEKALAAANSQHTTVPAQRMGAQIVMKLATEVLALRQSVDEIDRQITARFAEHEHAELMVSIPGFGPLLAAEFIAATGGDMSVFESADRLAGVAGLAPVPRDSGRVTGNNHRPKRYDRRLLRACFLAAQSAALHCPISKTYYDRKRSEGKNHTQAVLCLARRRINVIWAILRDQTPFTHEPGPLSLAA
ncbi:IS110 family transposase [Rathayibacter caricis]|uniref:IS110 family transposase n=1 Tax=Rathayibacter caricis TaxID=110936 RepID=UPI001FB34CC1|nr:IS110 family transposase [Rathayibacter caricis]MCJ1698026.1 IS110 family transposase [Rathayibacter caricis]